MSTLQSPHEPQSALPHDRAEAERLIAGGNDAVASGDLATGRALYESAHRVRPDDPEPLYNLGNVDYAEGRFEDALRAHDAALLRQPDHAGALNNRGNALRAVGRLAEALESYRRALALKPDSIGARGNVAAALLALHRPREALIEIARILEAAPDDVEALNQAGGAMLDLAEPEAALAAFRRALSRDPDHLQSRFGKALALLTLGRYAEGWRAYECRWDDPREPPLSRPRWTGEPLEGRTILLSAEQGLGDTIQFARYAPLVEARGGIAVLRVQAPLVPILGGLASRVVPIGDTVDADLECPLLSLPRLFETDLTSVPWSGPYIRPDPSLRAAWADRLGPRTATRIGIAFSGNAEHPDDPLRSVPAAAFVAAFAGVELHVLQTDIGPDDRAALAGARIHAGALTDFAQTAALVSLMDAIVSVDTSLAHLAGAMGQTTHVVLQTASDFRWLLGRSDSPWYPTARLWRRGWTEGWDTVLERVGAAVSS